MSENKKVIHRTCSCGEKFETNSEDDEGMWLACRDSYLEGGLNDREMGDS